MTPSGTVSAYELLAKARAKRETYKAQMAELEYRKASGQLLDADVVAATWVNQVGIAKGRLLSLPARLAPMVLNLKDLRAIEQVIRDAIHEALTELSADPQP